MLAISIGYGLLIALAIYLIVFARGHLEKLAAAGRLTPQKADMAARVASVCGRILVAATIIFLLLHAVK